MFIFKYPIPTLQGDFSIAMPDGAQVLTIQWQGEFPVMWAMVEPGLPKMRRKFRAIFTGEEIINIDFLKYICTMQLTHKGETLVVHYFEDHE